MTPSEMDALLERLYDRHPTPLQSAVTVAIAVVNVAHARARRPL